MSSLRSFRARTSATLLTLALAAGIAAGCGGSGSGGDTTLEVRSSDGPLAWLPADTWVVSQSNVGAKQIDTAVDTLGRLPIWSLAENFLPAKDGAGLRKAALKSIAKDAPGDITAADLEAAFGDTAGFALTSSDLRELRAMGSARSDDGPFAAWIETDDADKADEVFTALTTSAPEQKSFQGTDYEVAPLKGSGHLVWSQQGDLVLIAASAKQMERLISAHEGNSLADDADARRVFEAAGKGDALTSTLVGTDAGLHLIGEVIPTDTDAGLRSAVQQSLRERSLDALVPDWIGFGATIDDTGVRLRGTWSNPRELVDAKTDARDLAERFPADVTSVAARESDGSALGRIQAVWKDVKANAGLDLNDLPAQCPPAQRELCGAAADIATAVLEDEALAKAAEDQGDQTMAYAQYGLTTGTAGTKPTRPLIDVASTTKGQSLAHSPALKAALFTAGIAVTTDEKTGAVNIKIVPGSPIGAAIGTPPTPEAEAALAPLGLDGSELFTKGITLTSEEVDGLYVSTFPQGVKSAAAETLGGDGDALGDDDDYQTAVKAAGAPKDVDAWYFVDMQGLVDQALAEAAKQSPDVNVAGASIRNNLSDLPGIVAWSSHTEVDGEDVGVGELSIPISK